MSEDRGEQSVDRNQQPEARTLEPLNPEPLNVEICETRKLNLNNSTDERDHPESQDDEAGNFVHQRQFALTDFTTKNACSTA